MATTRHNEANTQMTALRNAMDALRVERSAGMQRLIDERPRACVISYLLAERVRLGCLQGYRMRAEAFKELHGINRNTLLKCGIAGR